MIDYDNQRIDELRSLNSVISTEDARYIVTLENTMTKHKDMIIELNDCGIIKDDELNEKISACFDYFLSEISKYIGPETCKSIYGYESGEKLDFLGKIGEGQLVADAQKLVFASSELEEIIHGRPEYTPLHNVAAQISESSRKLSRHVFEEHETLLSLDVDLSRSIESFKGTIIPIAILHSDEKITSGTDIYEIREAASAIELLLEKTSHSIRKLVRE